jgi:hypothetical protein
MTWFKRLKNVNALQVQIIQNINPHLTCFVLVPALLQVSLSSSLPPTYRRTIQWNGSEGSRSTMPCTCRQLPAFTRGRLRSRFRPLCLLPNGPQLPDQLPDPDLLHTPSPPPPLPPPSTLLFDPASCQSSTLHTRVFADLRRDENDIATSLVSYAPTTTYCTYKGRLQFRSSSRRDPPFSKLTLSPDRLEGQSVVY